MYKRYIVYRISFNIPSVGWLSVRLSVSLGLRLEIGLGIELGVGLGLAIGLGIGIGLGQGIGLGLGIGIADLKLSILARFRPNTVLMPIRNTPCKSAS